MRDQRGAEQPRGFLLYVIDGFDDLDEELAEDYAKAHRGKDPDGKIAIQE